jgi:hypothetical protein
MPTGEGDVARPRVRVSDLGEFIRFDSCERRFKLSHDNRAEARRLPFFERLFSSLDPVLQQAGNIAEDEWQAQLLAHGYRELAPAETVADDDGSVRPARTPWRDFAAVAATLEEGELAYGREILVEGTLGAFDVLGAIDFVLIEWRQGRPALRLVEGKSSRKDRTYHRIQLVCYLALLQEMLASEPLRVGGQRVDGDQIEVAVARIEEDSGRPQALLDLKPLPESDRERSDILRLLAGDGRLIQIINAPLDEVPYQLNGKCDGCVFNIDCLTESGRQRRLELLGIAPSTTSALREAGIHDLDALAELDIGGDQGRALRMRPGFTESLARLRDRARARRSTLPRGDQDPEEYEVHSLPHSGAGQLPRHEQDGALLVRIYVAVDYDYTENRIGALSAHVTRSPRELVLTWAGTAGDRWPDPRLHERLRNRDEGDDGRLRFSLGDPEPLDESRSKTIVHEVVAPWTGELAVDSGVEKHLIQSFFSDVVDAIIELARGELDCPLHFYVWSRDEVSRLVEACARADSRLLGHLRQLLGARESLEQLIFSSVGEEVDGRFGLGWTGRGLIVATSLSWFGARFHWRRRVGGRDVDLDRVFAQDLFDFKTALGLDDDGTWARDADEADQVHRFEVRSRNFDTLPAPYWRAVWGTLPQAQELNSPRVAGALRRYAAVDRPLLRAYLAARVEALRWIEERVVFKNAEIFKEPLAVDELPRFDLGVNDIARASVDVLRLDSHVKATGWIAEHLAPVRERVASGVSLPVRDVTLSGGNALVADIDLAEFDADPELLHSNWAPGSFVRLTLRGADPAGGQTYGQLTRAGVTGVLRELDWESAQLEIDVIGARQTHYVFPSASTQWAADRFDFATVDSSPSDFVAGRVERRLLVAVNAPAVAWLDPVDPRIPAAPPVPTESIALARAVLESLRDPEGNGLDERQVAAVLDCLQTRLHLLQGPPGTGKTATTAAAILARILARRSRGDVLLVGANTHTAVDGLLRRILELRGEFRERARGAGGQMPMVRVLRVDPDDPGHAPADLEIRASACVRQVTQSAASGVVVIGGTTSGLLKMASSLARSSSARAAFSDYSELVVDEASMMMLPHFLALATLVRANGFAMVAGDHRQLAPIMAHDWDSEDRPPIEIYQPHISAYEAIRRIADDPRVQQSQASRSALELTFRLPPSIVRLVGRVYRDDGIQLEGLPRPERPAATGATPWEVVWRSGGLFLVVHGERASRKANPTEVDIIRELVKSEGVPPAEDVAIVTPHRAQREMLRAATAGRVDVVDTVERLQGGERSAIVVSATASDPSAISAAADFILDLNRSNVAFSRVRDTLIVVCARTLLDYIPGDIDQYDAMMLWKTLRTTCSERIGSLDVDGAAVEVMRPPPPT